MPSVLSSLSSKLRDITDPFLWIHCFLLFMAIKLLDPLTRQLFAYAITNIDLARKHPGPGYLMYNIRFRQQMNAGAPLKWEELNPSLVAATVLSARMGEGQLCSLCISADHTSGDCALAPLDPNRLDQCLAPQPLSPCI